ncbi:hypothetical protein HZC53_02255 [Candidatus Uhrbacteria bacterium]|nr:hypothetical protein [Candidatus Uhrbacteria bacterium]
MPVTRQTFDSFADMPDGLRIFLFSEEFNDAENRLQKNYSFSDEQKILIGDQMMDVMFGDSELKEAVEAIKTALVPKPLDENRWKELLIDLLKVEVWPLRDLLGSELTQILEEYRISTAGWPQTKIYLKPMTYSAAAGEVASLAGFTLLSPQARERLRDLIMSRVKGVRIDAQVKEVLVRPADFGGLGLNADEADKTIKTINDLIANVKVMSEDEYADWLSEEARRKTDAEIAAKKAAEGPAAEEDPEIAKIKAAMPVPSKPATVLDEAVEKIYASLTYKPTDEYLINRLRHIISSRLRDVRSALEVIQLLQRDTKVGGVGLDQQQARTLGDQIETAYQTSHDSIMAEEKKKIDIQMLEQKNKIEERKQREAEEHAKWYQEKIQVRQQEETQKQQMAEQMKKSFMAGSAAPAPALPMDIKEAKKEKERFGDMVPAVAAGAAPIAAPKTPETVPITPFTTTNAPVQAARPEVKVSKETIMKQTLAPGLKPRIDDVKFASPRLTGLVDELKQVTLSEFRRMAKDPEGAAQKILQKIETLGGESFEKRVKGIQAWQQSPMQQAYLSLVSESFRQGKSVPEVAEIRHAAGQDSPSPAEVAAVISLNSKLHF